MNSAGSREAARATFQIGLELLELRGSKIATPNSCNFLVNVFETATCSQAKMDPALYVAFRIPLDSARVESELGSLFRLFSRIKGLIRLAHFGQLASKRKL